MYTTGDFLIQIKNGYMARRKEITLPYSKISLSIAKILTEEGYIKSAKEISDEGRKKIQVELLYKNKRPAIRGVKLVSKPSVHKYMSKNNIKRMGINFGITVLSTSLGVMTGEQAVKKGVGGELLCEIS